MWNRFRWIASLAQGARRGSGRPRRRRPGVEGLEGRAVPATFAVTTFADVVTPSDGRLSLREAIGRANTTPEHDTILMRAGVYKITTPYDAANPDPNATGSFDVLKNLSLVGAGAGRTVIDGGKIDRVFAVTGTAAAPIGVLFHGLTVRGGEVNGPGGGILMGHTSLTLRDCAVVGNRVTGTGVAGYGGGISNALAPGTGGLTLIRSTVSDNAASEVGGGVYLGGNPFGNGSPLSLSGSTVLRNSARSGGGVFASRVTLTSSVVSGNRATLHGGGLSVTYATLAGSTVGGNTAGGLGGGLDAEYATLTNSTVRNNTAGLSGGGVSAQVRATLIGCTVSGNFASREGGGVVAETATLLNSTVSGNIASREGGGVFASFLTLQNCTVARNEAFTGGGVYHFGPADGATVKNTILALNHAYGGPTRGYDVFGAFTSGGHNLVGMVNGSTGWDLSKGDLFGDSVKPLDPKLAPLANNGGPTQTHALLAASPAIDKGDNSGAPGIDQRGGSRRKDGDRNGRAVVDIGAVER